MSERIHALAQSLLGKSSIDECSLEEIHTITDKYPYFAPAQFLLLEKLKQEDSDNYQRQLQKSVLYYHNPVGFEQFLSSGRFWIDKDAPALNAESEVSFNENSGSPEIAETMNIEEPSRSPYSEEPGIQEELPGEPESDTEIIEKEGENETAYSETESEPQIDLTPISAGSLNEVYPPVNEPITDLQTEKEEPSTIGIKAADDETTVEEEKSETIGNTGLPLVGTIETEPGSAEKEPGDATTGFVFEPYHTVDYFASQGIKANLEEIPKDKLSKQLRSFTEWLKTMKKLPANEAPKNVDTNLETKVVSMANQSVNDSDIVTEAMAEVWLKQGNKQKALEIYNKLVLLDPSKKAFFAGKIENLKNLS